MTQQVEGQGPNPRHTDTPKQTETTTPKKPETLSPDPGAKIVDKFGSTALSDVEDRITVPKDTSSIDPKTGEVTFTPLLPEKRGIVERAKELFWGTTTRKVGTVALAVVAATGVTLGVTHNSSASTQPNAPVATGPANPGTTAPSAEAPSTVPSAEATNAAPTEAPSTTPSAPESTSNKELAAQLEKQEAMTPEAFFERPKDEQMVFLGAVLEKAKQFQEGYYDVNLPIDDEAKQLYNFNPLLNETAPEDMSDQDVVNQYLHNLQAAYHGTELDAKGELYKSHDLDTSLKTSMLVAYYPEGSDFRNLLANLEAYGSSDGNLNGTITANSEKSENTPDNADREGNEHLSRRVAFTMNYAENGEDKSVSDVINFFWVEGKLQNGDTFGTWIPYNK